MSVNNESRILGVKCASFDSGAIQNAVSPDKDLATGHNTCKCSALAECAVEHKRNLQENGIPADVLDALLPGDDVVELDKPVVAGGFVYRFAKRCLILSLVGQPLSYFPL